LHLLVFFSSELVLHNAFWTLKQITHNYKKTDKIDTKRYEEIATLLANFPTPYISHTFNILPRLASRPNPTPTSHSLLALMANPYDIPPGNPAFGRMSALNSPLPSQSGTPTIEQPLVFMPEQLAHARSALRLTPQDLPDIDRELLSGTLLPESTTITLLSQLLKGLVRVSHELSGVTLMLAAISQDNAGIREELHEVSTQHANLPPEDQNPPPALADLPASIGNLSHHGSATIPALCQAPAPTRAAHSPFIGPGPGPSGKEKQRARAPPTPTPTAAEDSKYLIPFYYTKLGKAFGHPKMYAKLVPCLYEASEYRRGAYDVASFTHGNLHPDNNPPPPILRLPLAPVHAARTGKETASSPPPNKLRVPSPLLVIRGLPPSHVPKVISLLLASPLPLTQTLQP